MLIYLSCKLRFLAPARLAIARLMDSMRHFCSFFREQRLIRVAPWIGAFFVCVLLFSLPVQARQPNPCPGKHIDEWARVEYVFDGDTIRLSDGRRVRFIAINAPELAHGGRSAQPLAKKARRRLLQLLPVGSRVGLRFGKAHFGPYHRVLANIFDSHRRNVSALLVREGLAFAIAMPPDLKDSRCYFRQEAFARARHRGIWHLAYYRPWPAREWRTHAAGFNRIRGRISHIGQSRHSLWLDMGRHVGVRISRKNLPYFSALPIRQWLGKTITVRGWTYRYRQTFNLILAHPAMIENKP